MGTIFAASVPLFVDAAYLVANYDFRWRVVISRRWRAIMDNLNDLVLVAALLLGVVWWFFTDSTSC